MFREKIPYSFILILLYLAGCSDKLPEIKTIESSFSLINQDSSQFIFPDIYRGKILVTGFIFINCPDICPLTIHNLQLIQKKISEEKINNVEFAAISFDPLRDTPQVLKGQVELRDIDIKNFNFLTGEKPEVDSLLKIMNVFAIAEDTTYTNEGEPVYFFIHTDRIALIDQQGNIRKEYSGSKTNIEEITADIKILGD